MEDDRRATEHEALCPSTPSFRYRRAAAPIRTSAWAACWLLLLLFAGVATAESTGEVVDRLQSAAGLIAEGKSKKAIEILEELEAETGGDLDAAQVLLARAFNDEKRYQQSSERAWSVLVRASDPEVRAVAGVELAYAIAHGEQDAEALPAAIDEARSFLRSLSAATPVSDTLRVRLCKARGELPEQHPLSLQNPFPMEAAESAIDFAEPEEAPDGYVFPRKILAPQPPPLNMRHRSAGPSTASTSARILIDLDGCVTWIKTQETTSQEWSRISSDAYRTWIFRPATVDGHPVASWYGVTTTFERYSLRPG